jgi:hypothetical protein
MNHGKQNLPSPFFGSSGLPSSEFPPSYEFSDKKQIKKSKF